MITLKDLLEHKEKAQGQIIDARLNLAFWRGYEQSCIDLEAALTAKLDAARTGQLPTPPPNGPAPTET